MRSRHRYVLPLMVAAIACGDSDGGFVPQASATSQPQAGAPAATISSADSTATTGASTSRAPNAGPTRTAMPAMPAMPASASAAKPAADPAAPSGAAGAMASAAQGGNVATTPSGPAGFTVDNATGDIVFRTSPITIGAGEEAYTCFGATLEEDIVVDGFAKTAQPFVHHAQFFEALLPEPEGVSVCKEQFKLTWLPIFLAGNGASEMRFDEGIGHVIGAGTQLVLQMHLFNSTDKAATQAVEIRMHRAASSDVTPVAPWAIGSSQIHIPARTAATAQNVCTMSGPVDIVAVFPHMHMHGKSLKVEVGQSMDAMRPLYARDPFNFDDQRMEKMKISLRAGDMLRVTCDYMNTSDNELTFGESSTDEMCFFVGFAVGPFPSQADCPNLWDALLTL